MAPIQPNSRGRTAPVSNPEGAVESRATASANSAQLGGAIGHSPRDSWKAGTTAVTTTHNGTSRTGLNDQEKVLNTSNVRPGEFGKLFSRTVDGQIYAQPLYVPSVKMADGTLHNVIYVATAKNNLYAFDADDPTQTQPLWEKNLGAPVPSADVDSNDMTPWIGITSTPVIDRATHTVFVEAKSKEGGQYIQRLHAYDITSGLEKQGFPVEIRAQVKGTGAGSQNGKVTFDPHWQLQRAGLLESNDTIYMAFGAHGDNGPYHGWVLAYDKNTGKQTGAFNTTPDARAGGIWQAGGGLAADKQGNVYLESGNGYGTDPNSTPPQLGESFIKLAPKTLALEDWFMPHNYQELDQKDLDLGSSGPILVPGTDLVVGGGKQALFYLLDTQKMGHFHPNDDNQAKEVFGASDDTSGGKHIHGVPAIWNGPNGPVMYVWPEMTKMSAFQFDPKTQQFNPKPTSQSPYPAPQGMPGGILSVSSNGTDPNSAIVWASMPTADNANQATVAGTLRAFAANNLTHELWNSNELPSDGTGNFAKFVPPTVADGKVFMATFSDRLDVFGLKPNTLAAGVGALPNGTADKAIQEASARNGGMAGTGAPFGNGNNSPVAVHRWGAGQVQDMTGGTLGTLIAMHRDGAPQAWIVRGAIRDAYFAAQGAASFLGYPLEEEHLVNGAALQQFEGGYITRDPASQYFKAYPGKP